jgi:hypothetical protein
MLFWKTGNSPHAKMNYNPYPVHRPGRIYQATRLKGPPVGSVSCCAGFNEGGVYLSRKHRHANVLLLIVVFLGALGVAATTAMFTPDDQHTTETDLQSLEITPTPFPSATATRPLVVTAHIWATQPAPTPATPDSSTSALPAAPVPIAGAIGPEHVAPDINPLTGLQVADSAVLDRRPIVAKISNAPPLVRPQSGIGQADLVFEHYTEGGLTRFSAVFYSQEPERIGSIRSARLIDYHLVDIYEGLLAFSGASIGVEKVIYGWEEVAGRIEGSENTAPLLPLPPSSFADRAYMGVRYGRPYYWRDETIPAPHNMFTSAPALWDLAASQGHDQRPALHGMAFHPQAPIGAISPAAAIDLRYRATRILWQYDAASGFYERSADGQGHFDFNTGQQIAAANVVLIYADHIQTDIVESQFGNSIAWSTQIDLFGQGNAVLFRDGQRYDGLWVRDPASEDVIGLRTTSGEYLYFKPGITWFQILPLTFGQIPAEEWLVVG